MLTQAPPRRMREMMREHLMTEDQRSLQACCTSTEVLNLVLLKS